MDKENHCEQIFEIEMSRLKQTMHGGISQQLTGVSLLAASLEISLAERMVPEAPQVARLSRMVNDAIVDIRKILWRHDLKELHEQGLNHALSKLMDFYRREKGLDCTYRAMDTADSIPASVAVQLYRIAKEAVIDAVENAHATSLDIQWEKENNSIRMMIADDAQESLEHMEALDPTSKKLIELRVQIFGGNVRYKTRQPYGKVIVCEYLLDKKYDADIATE